jgi:hypothetical protein
MVDQYQQYRAARESEKAERRFKIKTYMQAYEEFQSGLSQGLSSLGSGMVSMAEAKYAAGPSESEIAQSDVAGSAMAAAGGAMGGTAGLAMQGIGQGMQKDAKRRRRRRNR